MGSLCKQVGRRAGKVVGLVARTFLFGPFKFEVSAKRFHARSRKAARLTGEVP